MKLDWIEIRVISNNDMDNTMAWPTRLSFPPSIGERIYTLNRKQHREIVEIIHMWDTKDNASRLEIHVRNPNTRR